jgi:hypothetical protein
MSTIFFFPVGLSGWGVKLTTHQCNAGIKMSETTPPPFVCLRDLQIDDFPLKKTCTFI